MKEDRKIQLNYLKYQIFTPKKISKINVTRKLGIIASGRVGHNYKDFFKKNK